MGGGPSKWSTFRTTTTLPSQRAEPSLLWCWLSRNAASDAEREAFSASATTKRSEAAPRVSPLARRGGAPHERGESGGSDPPFLSADAPSGGVKWSTPGSTTYPSSGGRSLPPQWSLREGHRANKQTGGAASTTGGELTHERRRRWQQQPELGAGRNWCRHATLHRRRLVRPFKLLRRLKSSGNEPHSLSLPPCVRSSQRAHFRIVPIPAIGLLIELYYWPLARFNRFLYFAFSWCLWKTASQNRFPRARKGGELGSGWFSTG